MKKYKILIEFVGAIILAVFTVYVFNYINVNFIPKVDYAKELAYAYLDENYDDLVFNLKLESFGDRKYYSTISPLPHKDKNTSEYKFEVSVDGIPFTSNLYVYISKNDSTKTWVTEVNSFRRLYNYYQDFTEYFKDKEGYTIQYDPDVCIISQKKLVEEVELVSDIIKFVKQDKNMNTGVKTYMKFSDGDLRFSSQDTKYESTMNYIYILRDMNNYLIDKGYEVSINYTPNFSQDNINPKPVIRINETRDNLDTSQLKNDLHNIIEKYEKSYSYHYIISFNGYEEYI